MRPAPRLGPLEGLDAGAPVGSFARCMLTFPVAAAALGGYLAGAIPFGWLVARVAGGIDPRRHGSGNIGATNVWRLLGARAGIAVLALDFGKGLGPVLAARRLAPTPAEGEVFGLVAGIAAILGHVFPVYLGFRGGKGVATGGGALAALAPLPTAIAIVVWGVVLGATRYVSLASIAAALALPLAFLAVEREAALGGSRRAVFFVGAAASLLVVARHRTNIRRLLAGTEPRAARRGAAPRGAAHALGNAERDAPARGSSWVGP